jgi:hypothetical protein
MTNTDIASTLTLEQLVRESTVENRGDPDNPYGAVYFQQPNYEGQQVRVGYVSNDDGAYIFTMNWGEPTYWHLIAAWDLLVIHDVRGFRKLDAAQAQIRWKNGWEGPRLYDRAVLVREATLEQRRAKRRAVTA